jgi:4-amino-4-deoxy-L-arabinose transferase-like glycosyltransferase
VNARRRFTTTTTSDKNKKPCRGRHVLLNQESALRLANFEVRLGHQYHMVSNRLQALFWAGITLLLLSVLLAARLSGFGIWDPWELNMADAAQKIALGKTVAENHSLSVWLVAIGLKAFGLQEWAGRVPIVIFGVVALLVAYYLVNWFVGQRAAIYAVIVTATTPLFLFNARPMLGETVAFTFQAAVGLCAAAAIFKPTRTSQGSLVSVIGWLVALLIFGALGVETRGALQCVFPPLAAVSCVAALQGFLLRPKKEPFAALASYVVVGITLVLAALITADVVANRSEFSRWIGGLPSSVKPLTYEAVLETIFHSFAPWSAILPIAFVRMLASPNGESENQIERRAEYSLRLVLFLWIFFGYGAQTLFISRYGSTVAYLPVVALGAAVALFLYDIEQGQEGSWTYAIIATCLTGLIIRDYSLYPEAPIKGMPVVDFKVPTVLDLKKAWAAAILPTALLFATGLAVTPSDTRPDLRKPYRILREQWRRGFIYKLWLILGGLSLTALLVLGVFSFVAPKTILLTTLAVRVFHILGFIPFALPLFVIALQYLPWLYGRLKGRRFIPAVVASLFFAFAAAQIFLPQFSEHFSPREVFDTYNKLGADSQELAEYQIGARAAGYYAHGKVREINKQAELIDYLVSSNKRWAVFPADDLANIDRTFRRRVGDHLFVADARNARVLLATNKSIEGEQNQNLLAKYILKEPPKIQHPVHARFDDKLEFLGYNLDLPHKNFIGAGESFKISWVFKVLKAVPGSYQLFVHVDGSGQRINGDHEPIDGKYPVRLWEKDDVIVDTQELAVPSHFPRADYDIFMGLFSGDNRMPVLEGPKDDSNRLKAGILPVR